MRQSFNWLLAMLLMMPLILILMFECFMLMMMIFVSAKSFFDCLFHMSHSRIGEELQNVKLRHSKRDGFSLFNIYKITVPLC